VSETAQHLEDQLSAEDQRPAEDQTSPQDQTPVGEVEESEVDEAELEGETEVKLDPEVAARRDAALAHVRKFGDPILKTKARNVEVFDEVGAVRRLLVYRVQSGDPLGVLVNPNIEWSSKEEEISEEGCLSLPSVHVDVERPVYIRVSAQDGYGEPILVEASGFEARVIQHEIDHLDGVLILDRTPREQRKEAMKTLREWQQRSDG
jgi:peptide deformylase